MVVSLNTSYKPNLTLDIWFTVCIYNHGKIVYNLPILHKNTAYLKWNRLNSEGNLIIQYNENKFTLVLKIYYRGYGYNHSYCDLVKYTGMVEKKDKDEWFTKILTRQFQFNY